MPTEKNKNDANRNRRVKLSSKSLKRGKPIPFVVVMACSLILIITFYLIAGLTDFVKLEAKNTVLNNTNSESAMVRYVLDDAMKSIEQISAEFSDALSDNDVVDEMYTLAGNLKFEYLKYNKGTTVYNQNGTVASRINTEVINTINAGVKGTSAIFTDNETDKKMIAFYAPVSSEFVSGIVGYYAIESIRSAVYFENFSKGQSSFICDLNGNIIINSVPKGIFKKNEDTVFSYLLANTNSQSVVQQIAVDFAGNVSDSIETELMSDSVIIAYSPITTAANAWYLVSVCPKTVIATNTTRFTSQILFSGLVTLLLFVAFFMYLWTMRTKYDGNIQLMETTDPLTGCNNYNHFQNLANDLIASSPKTKFALVHVDVKNFEYFKDNFDSETGNDLLIYISDVISKMLKEREIYGRVSADKFIIAFRYKNITDIIDRFKVLFALIYNYSELPDREYNVKLCAGIYEVDREKKHQVHDMVDRASIACRSAHEKSVYSSYVIYDESLRKSMVKKAEIEADMERSLRNNDFKLFLQPKYNIKTNCIDGAEALVRWNHPTKGFIPADDFVPLFESNGFITQIDRFMYVEACKYINKLILKGKRIVPISVNVSRVNAIQPSFLKFYIDCKHEYNIADGFIELEFTESFALESYETLNTIISSLKQSGISCSIDDFGAGYSSFSALKELELDTLKLDKLFLKKGSRPKREKVLLAAVINLGKSFGMKVVQEGVETPEELRIVREMGCDVAQGYLYSKPIPMHEFDEFLDNGFKGIPIATLREYYNDSDYYPEIIDDAPSLKVEEK